MQNNAFEPISLNQQCKYKVKLDKIQFFWHLFSNYFSINYQLIIYNK
jgi:hypothetical protein